MLFVSIPQDGLSETFCDSCGHLRLRLGFRSIGERYRLGAINENHGMYRIGHVVTLGSNTDSASWKLAVPLMHAGLNGDESGRTEPVVVYDDMGAGIGSLMAVTESADASTPFILTQNQSMRTTPRFWIR